MIKLLDHGYIKLLDVMGDDLTPATAARISFDGDPRGWDNGDGKLTKFLLENQHMSPFEMVEVMFEVQAPIFVAREWVRHRTANWNEFSMRYAPADRLGDGHVLVFEPAEFRIQDTTNKQSSMVPTDKDPAWHQDAKMIWHDAVVHTIKAYDKLIDMGVAREMARGVLPVATYTKWIWKSDLRNTMHFMELRQADNAQAEIREYANAMETLLADKLPNLMALWRESR